MKEALHILKKYWKYPSFRPLQEEIITAILKNENVLALLPTGGGKSICYQIPPLVKEGICIVISPLIALMEDQVSALRKKNIKAMALTGGMRYDELDKALDNCIYGNYKFLYLSPERLQQDIVQQRIRQMNVVLFAVDEAHCISQWGHDFRPAYRNISLVKDLRPQAPIAAFTATATPPVIKDIQEQLLLTKGRVYRQSFKRANIAYNVLLAEDKYHEISKLLQNKEETAIIYVRSRRATLETTQYLSELGFKARAFHGGLKPIQKQEALQQWMANEVFIMVATTAFGMGIDKPDVRQVIHLNLPESLESYFQEAGRAGRDGKLAKASLLTNKSDIPMLKNQFLANLPEMKEVKLVYKKLTAYFQIAYGEGELSRHDFDFSKFCIQYNFNYHKTYQALQILDHCSILRLSQQYRKRTEVQILVSGKHFNFYIQENPKFELLGQAILRTYGGIFEIKVPIQLSDICRKIGLHEDMAIQQLKDLHAEKLIDFDYYQFDSQILFLVPREDDTSINPFEPFIQHYLDTKKEKVEAVLQYVSNDEKCRSLQLLQYFGEKEVQPCGICSVCLGGKKLPHRKDMYKIYTEIIALLKHQHYSSREIISIIKKYPEQEVLLVLRLMLDNGTISRISNNSYKLN